MAWRNYGAITRPDGQWVRASGMCSVLGLEKDIQGFIYWADAAEKAHKKKLRFGADIMEALDGSGRIDVVGVAQTKSFFGKVSAKQWILGHIWGEVAKEMRERYVDKGVQIASELYSVHYDRSDPEVKIYILVPKGAKAKSA